MRRRPEIGVKGVGGRLRRASRADGIKQGRGDARPACHAIKRCSTKCVLLGRRQGDAGDGEGIGRAADAGDTPDLHTAERRTGVRIIVRNPDIGVAAAEQAGRPAEAQPVRRPPVQTDARLEQLTAIERRIVRETEAVEEILVEERPVGRVEQVPAEAGNDGQVVSHVDRVLQTKGPAVVGELGRHRIDAAADRRGDVKLVGALTLEIGDRIKIPATRNALGEQVANILGAAFGDELQRVVVHLQRRLQLDIELS